MSVTINVCGRAHRVLFVVCVLFWFQIAIEPFVLVHYSVCDYLLEIVLENKEPLNPYTVHLSCHNVVVSVLQSDSRCRILIENIYILLEN